MTMRIFSRLLVPLLLLGLLSGCGGRISEAVSAVSEPSAAAAPSPAQQEVSGTLTVVFPKIGSADAALLMTENATVLIDTGESNDGDEILDLLEEYGRDAIDLLIISHYDKDHVGGAAEILENIPVKRVIGSTSPKDSDEMEAYLAALEAAALTEETGDQTVTLGDLILQVDEPDRASYQEDQSNNSSNIVTVSFGETALLFAGDAMTERLWEYAWPENAYDLIKIPHHGRDAADTSYYLPALRSGATAVITSSKKEPESNELVSNLEAGGFTPYLTRNGTVIAVSDGKTLTITQE